MELTKGNSSPTCRSGGILDSGTDKNINYQYLKIIEKINIPNSESWIELVDCTNANINDQSRMEYISYIDEEIIQENNNNSSNITLQQNIHTKYRILQYEAAESTPSRVFEFIPIKLHNNLIKDMISIIDKSNKYNNNILSYQILHNEFLKYTYMGGEYIYTNLRNLLKFDMKYRTFFTNEFSQNKNFNDGFIIIKLYLPIEARNYLMNHTQLSKFKKNINSDNIGGNNEFQPSSTNTYSQIVLGGWLQDKNGWRNLLLEGSAIPEIWRNINNQIIHLYCKSISDLICMNYPEWWDMYIKLNK